jgi:hypothetical protein
VSGDRSCLAGDCIGPGEGCQANAPCLLRQVMGHLAMQDPDHPIVWSGMAAPDAGAADWRSRALAALALAGLIDWTPVQGGVIAVPRQVEGA